MPTHTDSTTTAQAPQTLKEAITLLMDMEV